MQFHCINWRKSIFFYLQRIQDIFSSEEDDLVSMRRDFHIDYEKKKEDRKRYVEEIKSFLAKVRSDNDISPCRR